MENKPKQAELHSDAWTRFERAVDVVAKSPPQHKAKSPKSPKGTKAQKPKRR